MELYNELLVEAESAPPPTPPTTTAIAEIANIDEKPGPGGKLYTGVIPSVPPKAKVCCDLLSNITEYTSPLYTGDTYGVLSLPVETTCTLNGTLSGIRFHERELINRVELNDDIAMLVCNYGEKRQPWYTSDLDAKVSTRGRKPTGDQKNTHPKNPNRKVQGSGKCFSSQLTFVTAHNNRTQFFKVKVFRTGFIQIPGSRPDLVNQSFDAIAIVVRELTRVFGGESPIGLSSLYLVMKDYKLHAPLNYDQALNLYALKNIFGVVKLRQLGLNDSDIMANIETVVAKLPEVRRNTEKILLRAEMLPPNGSIPPISDIKYNYYENKFSASFATPTPDDPDKHIRLVVFPDGYLDRNDHSKGYGCKIDILGAVDRRFTLDIYLMLLGVFRWFKDLLVVDVQARRRIRTTLVPGTRGRPSQSGKKRSMRSRIMDSILRNEKFDRVVEYPTVETCQLALDGITAMLNGEL